MAPRQFKNIEDLLEQLKSETTAFRSSTIDQEIRGNLKSAETRLNDLSKSELEEIQDPVTLGINQYILIKSLINLFWRNTPHFIQMKRGTNNGTLKREVSIYNRKRKKTSAIKNRMGNNKNWTGNE